MLATLLFSFLLLECFLVLGRKGFSVAVEVGLLKFSYLHLVCVVAVRGPVKAEYATVLCGA